MTEDINLTKNEEQSISKSSLDKENILYCYFRNNLNHKGDSIVNSLKNSLNQGIKRHF